MKSIGDLVWWMLRFGAQLSVDPPDPSRGNKYTVICLHVRYGRRMLMKRAELSNDQVGSSDSRERVINGLIHRIEQEMENLDANDQQASPGQQQQSQEADWPEPDLQV